MTDQTEIQRKMKALLAAEQAYEAELARPDEPVAPTIDPADFDYDKAFNFILGEIADDTTDERVPSGVPTFSALHDYVDANEYLIQAHEAQGDAPVGDFNDQEWVDRENALTDRVSAHLASSFFDPGDLIWRRRDDNEPVFPDVRPALSPDVAAGLRKVASALLEVVGAWQDNDQEAFDTSNTRIRFGIGQSLDELASEIFAFVEEN
jgi:hypothetical protein